MERFGEKGADNVALPKTDRNMRIGNESDFG